MPAVILAALPGFLVGGLRYSPTLFAEPWMTELGLRK